MVVLINPFEVAPEVADREFLEGWQRAADYLQPQPGIIGTRLHRAASPDARFRFVNVAEWASLEAFRAAVSSEGFRRIAGDNRSPNQPALYQVVRSITADATMADAPSEE